MSNLDVIAFNLRAVRERIAAAARRVKRDPEGVTLLAVTKGVDTDSIATAIAAGVGDLGENRVQEAAGKIPLLPPARWHLVGRLQTNKAKRALELFGLIHSLDRPSLAEELSRRAGERGRGVEVLVEVNVAGEAQKGGVALADAVDFVRYAAALPGIGIQGLMTVAPLVADPQETRPVFRALRGLADRLRRLAIPGVEMRYLSMGMSNDFEVAVEEGADLVRIGTAIFGPRPVEPSREGVGYDG